MNTRLYLEHIDRKNSYTSVVLIYAVKHSSSSVIQLILDQGVDTELEDENGYTALDHAVILLRYDVVNLLS